MAGVGEENRRRLALTLVLLGLGLIFTGLALALVHQHAIEAANEPAIRLAPAPAAQKIKYILFLLVLLVGIFSVSTLAFLRWSRRFRRWLFRQPVPPTPATDVWAMHRPPPETESPEPEQEPGGPA